MIRLYVTRHGETEWNVQRRMQGWRDSLLTEKGVRQAQLLGRRLAGIPLAAIYASSSGRALATADIIRREQVGAKSLVPIVPMPELREIHFGGWEGMAFEDVARQYPAEHQLYAKAPQAYRKADGESFYDLQARLLDGLDKIVRNHGEGDLLLVTHGIAHRMLLLGYLGRKMEDFWQPPTIAQTCLSVIEIESGRAEVKLYADATHLN